MRNILIVILCTLFSVSALASESKVAILDYIHIYEVSKIGKNIKEQINSIAAEREQHMQEKTNKFKEEQAALEKKRAALSKEAFQKIYKEYMTKVEKFQVETNKRNGELENKISVAHNAVNKTLSTIVENLAQKEGYAVVINKQAVIYNNRASDITEAVLKKLDAELTSFKILK